MEEARFSINARFSFLGFDSQVTVRSDHSLGVLLKDYQDTIHALQHLGAVPRNGQPDNSTASKDVPGSAPVCEHCGNSDAMEHIRFEKDGKPRKAWKCQACNKWHYDKEEK